MGGRAFLCGVCMFSPCSHGFPPVLQFPSPSQKHVQVVYCMPGPPHKLDATSQGAYPNKIKKKK
ncbi:hypothetical protein LDENG_00202690 [Lucifuga dentata]|nr:hypothetical protein LDENG_00202690 [Lucifuga dentata]